MFKGLDRAFGKYVMDENIIATDGEKQKGHGITVREDVLPEHYVDHLEGKDMLGVVPIMDGNQVRFAAIDIDDYNMDIPAVLTMIREMNLPLVPTRSKSGGLHLWFFFVHDVPARAAMQKLEEIADALGFPGVEIFPKQHQIAPTDVGNWINLPWFDHTDTSRYGWDDDGEEINDLEAWINFAEAKRLTLKDMNRVRVRELEDGNERPFSDGPPCLQSLAERGIPEGMRNNVMFSIGIYAHNRFDENVQQLEFMYQTNKDFLDPRMDDRELERIRQGIDENDYRYPCTQAPIKDHCNRQLCLRRKYGVRLNGEVFSFGSLWQFIPVTIEGDELYDEASWRLQVNHNDEQHMLDLTTEELMKASAVQMKAIVRRFVLPPHDNNEWRDLMEVKIQTCEVVHVPEELSSVGVLRHHISQFLNLFGAGTESKQEISHGKAWLDEEDDLYWFKSESFLNYLKQQRYGDHSGTSLNNILRERFGFETNARRRLEGSATRLWMCPMRLRIRKDVDAAPEYKETF